MNLNLWEKIEPSPTEIKKDRKYWLIRTEAGTYYENYINNNYVAIGWNEFNNREDFSSKKMTEKMENDILAIDAYKEKQAGRIYNQIRKFLFDIKIGDVVMIPSENSEIITFGIVNSDFFNREVSEDDTCPYIKSRSISWIKTIARNKLDPYLFKMMQSHQTINNADDYAHYIDRTMYSYYEKDGKSYLILPVNKNDDIPAYDLSQFINSITDLIPTINKIFNSDNNKIDVDIKINVQSPGFVELNSTDKTLMQRISGFLKLSESKNSRKSINPIDEVLQRTSPANKDEMLRNLDEIESKFKKVQAELPEELK